MRVFVTGSTGFIGSCVVQELLKSGHDVHGLVRSESSAAALQKTGAKVIRGDLEDHASLKNGVKGCDAIIHTGFVHDFSRFKEICEIDRAAVAAMGEALGANKPFVITSGTALVTSDQPADESAKAHKGQHPRIASEEAAEALAAKGVKAMIMRLPPTVHGEGDKGFIPMIIDLERRKGVVGYIGEGQNVWPAVHRKDAARCFLQAMLKGTPGGVYHAVAEQGVPMKQIAEAIAKGTGLKASSQPPEFFEWIAGFVGMNNPISSARTREQLDWKPTDLTLLEDLAAPYYFNATS